MTKCEECLRRSIGKGGEMIFNHGKFSLKTRKTGSECKDCAIFLANFEKYREQIIKKEEGVIIDWNFYSHANEIKSQLNEILVALNILTYSSNENWEVVDASGIKSNPSCSDGHLYFTRKEDVFEFINFNYRRMALPCEIRRISEVEEYLPEFLIVSSSFLR